MILQRKNRIDFFINENDFTPNSEVTLSIVDNLAYQVCLLMTKRSYDTPMSITDQYNAIKSELSAYNETHFSGVISAKRIEEIVSAALSSASQGRINVGKNVTDGIITLSVKTV